MSRVAYDVQVQDPKWKALRDKIVKRDWNQCQLCRRQNPKGGLHVHHKAYRAEWNAWEYPESWLITLCWECHARHHGVDPQMWAGERIGGVLARILGEPYILSIKGLGDD